MREIPGLIMGKLELILNSEDETSGSACAFNWGFGTNLDNKEGFSGFDESSWLGLSTMKILESLILENA